MTGKIFINYRRGDDPQAAGRLFDRLQDVFEPQQLFLDVDNIAPGLDFVRVLDERVAECDIVLAVIGKGWLDTRDADGKRRLDDPDDFVRIEITSALDQGKRVIPVLVGDAPMPHPEDLPEVLRPLTRRNAVRLTHERFRADTQGLIKALQESLTEIEARRQAEAEARRQALAEDERKGREAEAARRAEEETQKLKAALQAREEAYRSASASDDPAVLKSFLATYAKGADAAQVRARLHQIKPRPGWQPPRLAIAALAAVAVLLLAGASLYWLANKPTSPATQQVKAATTTAPSPVSGTAPAAVLAIGTSPETTVPAGPSPDEVAWQLLQDTTDDAALRRFIRKFPESPLRKRAEARLDALSAEQAARADAAAEAELAAKAQAQQALEAERAKAAAQATADLKAQADAERAKAAAAQAQPGGQKTALATPPDSGQAAPTPLSGPALVQAIKMELTRVGCYDGKLDDDWSSAGVKQSIVKFVEAANLLRVPDDPSTDFLNSIRSQSSRICPLDCAKTETMSNGKCIVKTCPSGQKLDSDGDCAPVRERSASRPSSPKPLPRTRPAPAARTVATGEVGITCGRYGCKEHPIVNAPAGLPCKQAFQGKRGGWFCR